MMRYLRLLCALAYWSVVEVGYWVRPYDMLADRRRWRWQPAQYGAARPPAPPVPQ